MNSMRSAFYLSALCLIVMTIIAPPRHLHAADDNDQITDMTITDHVEDELLFDHGVSSHKVDVSTTDGIVTLTGTVNNVLAKERAALIAETVKGVRSVINRITVAPSILRSDQEIADDVKSAFVDDPAADSWEITTKVQNNTVTLTGTVDSYQEKELAGLIAKGVRGVKDVKNSIIVSYNSDRLDGEILNDIEQSLRWSVLVDHGLIDVKVNNGKVTLSGTVGSAAEKRQARYAAWVTGVESIDDSKLEVEDWARDEHRRKNKYVIKSSEEVRDAINDALLYDPRAKSFNIDPDVIGSTVTLRGKVDSLAAKRAAEQVARNTVGVSTVYNRLKVRPVEPIKDETIESDIKSALLRDPYVERFEITVSVYDGVANLYGTVDSYFEKSQAEFVAGGVPGVVEVRNYLDVDYDKPWVYDPFVEHIHLWHIQPVPILTTDKSDSEILEEINDQLWWSPFVDSDQVIVTVDDGVATLTGTVDSESERSKAVENAWEGGAIGVLNKLQVE